MKRLTPYYAYRAYVSVREHFKGTYNLSAHKWNFIRPQEKQFDTWKHRNIFVVLANHKISSLEEWLNLLIAVFVSNPMVSIFDLLEDYDYYKKKGIAWRSHIDNMPHTFIEEMKPLITEWLSAHTTFNRMFPDWIMQQFLNRRMCVESFIIIKTLMQLQKFLDGKPNYEYLYRDQYEMYETLLNVSTEKYRKPLIDLINLTKERLAMD